MRSFVPLLLLLVFLALPLSGCDSEDPAPASNTISDLAQATPDLSTLVTALAEAGLVDDLEGDGPFTVFAPVNSAFDALGADVVGQLLADGNGAILSKVLTYHVVPGLVLSTDLSDGQQATTLQGSDATITLENGEAFIDGVRIISTDIIADNGVVHLIEGVLTTPLDIVDTATIQGFGNLVAALDVAELDDDLMGDGPFTVFAPTDQAFEEAATALGTDIAGLLALDNLDEILLYHVVSGSVLASNLSDGLDVMTLNGASFTVLLNSGAAIDTDGDDAADATITATDLEVGNGVIHVIDAVLLPPAES